MAINWLIIDIEVIKLILKKTACQTRSNHNKEELGCVPEPLLKHYHKTSKVSLDGVSPNMHFIINNRTI